MADHDCVAQDARPAFLWRRRRLCPRTGGYVWRSGYLCGRKGQTMRKGIAASVARACLLGLMVFLTGSCI